MKCRALNIICFVLLLTRCHGAISFDLVKWDSGLENFDDRDDVAVLSNPGGYLNAGFVLSLPGALVDVALNASDYQDDYTSYSALSLRFAFYGYGVGGLQSLYFESDAAGDSIWEYAFTTPDQAWQTNQVSFTSSTGWNEVTATGTPSSWP